MNEQEYIQEVLRTYMGKDSISDKLCLGALGLAGESGEVVDAIKKILYQGHALDVTKLTDELGDVFWYFTLICHALNISLEDIKAYNVAKMRKRYPNGFEPERSIYRQELLQKAE
jgi:NTP pyrophosphatase (non-canonical NTP hydrolase)